jgi:hypothetical protein
VLGAASSTPASPASCDAYLTAFIRFGGFNDSDQVKRLQAVLHDFEGAAIGASGVYDAATHAAVHAFQKKYESEILTPWGISKSTGYVYLTTRKKINEIYCRNLMAFPLTEGQQEEVSQIKAQVSAKPSSSPVSAHTAVPPTQTLAPLAPVASTTSRPQGEVTTPPVGTEQKPGLIRTIMDFFKNLFDREP